MRHELEAFRSGRWASVLIVGVCLGLMSVSAWATELPETIERVKPSVVGVGTYMQTRQPRSQLQGTGFVVGDGLHVITNDHVLPNVLDADRLEFLAVFVPGDGRQVQVRRARAVASDPARDLTLLRIDGEPMPVLRLGNPNSVREGQAVAFTGFPIGAALGLFPATHRGTVSAIAPVVIPARSGRELDPALIRRMREPYTIFQLDATAYPGNSGSPLFDPATGQVLGVLNMVFVKEGRESALDRPSGISYAIPVDPARALLEGQGLRP